MKKIIALFVAVVMIGSMYAQVTYTPIKVEAKSKIHHKWKGRDTRILENIHGYTPEVHPTNRYGSDCRVRYDSTGFYHVVQDVERWWIVDPDGYRNINRAVVSLRQGRGENCKRAFDEKYNGKSAQWNEDAGSMLRELHFNGVGAWSSISFVQEFNKSHEEQLSYTPILNLMSGYGKRRGGTYQRPGNTGYPNQCIFVFDKGFKAYCEEKAAELVKYKDDRNILGYFSDNEMPITLKNLEGYLDLPKHEEGRKAAEKWLRKKRVKREEITDELRSEFAGYVAERYYSIVEAAIRKYDPNHMYLGSRLHGRPMYIRQVVEAAARHCDIVAFNYYGVWTPSQKHIRQWRQWSGNKPLIVTEFYTKGMDSGMDNTSGAGWVVKTQKDRGYAYQHFTLALLEAGNFVGWQWFKYQDNDTTDLKADPSNRDSNKGMVDCRYERYTDLTELMKNLNSNVYSLIDFMDKKAH
ncbi:MAG: agarase [Alistipes sp.]|nr:agarase [Alistipes sp.]